MTVPARAVPTIQLALANNRIALELQRMLAVSTEAVVSLVDKPDLSGEGCCVVVVDSARLHQLPRPIPFPERMVVISEDSPEQLKTAWEAGVNSVVFDRDPLSTVVLAILSACLRSARPRGRA